MSSQPEVSAMSDPRYRDPRLSPSVEQDEDEIRSQRLTELESSNAMWGWIVGAVVLALVLMFVFTRGGDSPMMPVPSKQAQAPVPTCTPQMFPGNILHFNCTLLEASSALSTYLEGQPTRRVKTGWGDSTGTTVVLE
jgi:hypothetical protein